MKTTLTTLALACLIAPVAPVWAQEKPAEASTPTALVQTAPVQRQPIAPLVRAYGTVTLAQDGQDDISLPYAAQITRLAVSAGQAVRRGDVLFVASSDPAAVLAVQQAQNAVTLARGELERTRALLAQRLATRSQLAAAEKALADAEQAQAAQQQLGVQPGERAVRATHDAVVLKLAAVQGDRVAAGTPVLQLARSGAAVPTRVTLGLEPALRRAVPVGAAVTITSLSGPADAQATPLHASVRRVQAAINLQSRLVDVNVELAPNQGAALVPGESVQGTIALPSQTHWVVPRQAVLQDEQGAFVFQVEQGRARRVPVQIKVDNNVQLGVEGALQVQQPLVIQGHYQLSDGMAVREGQQ